MKFTVLLACLLCTLRASWATPRKPKVVAYFNSGDFSGPIYIRSTQVKDAANFLFSHKLEFDFSELKVTGRANEKFQLDIRHMYPYQPGAGLGQCGHGNTMDWPFGEKAFVVGPDDRLHLTEVTNNNFKHNIKSKFTTSGITIIDSNNEDQGGYLGRTLAFKIAGQEKEEFVACATMEEFNSKLTVPVCGSAGRAEQHQVTMEAVFHGKVSGRVIFRSLPSSHVTTFIASLSYTDGRAGNTFNTMRVLNQGAGPDGKCLASDDLLDFTETHGSIRIGSGSHVLDGLTIASGYLQAYSRDGDENLVKFTIDKIKNKSLLIYSDTGRKLACAPIHPIQRRTFTAHFGIGQGTVTVSQDSPLDSARISANMAKTPTSLGIHRQQAVGSSCQHIGHVFNPTRVHRNPASGLPHEKYPSGLIGAKFPLAKKLSHCDSTMTLFGTNSVAGRSVAAVIDGKRLCANLKEDLSNGQTVVYAKATFTAGAVSGTVTFRQVQSVNGSTEMTTITSDGLRNHDNSTTRDHSWYVYSKRTGFQSTKDACSGIFTGLRYNPFAVPVNSQYSDQCTETNQLRCHVGDLAAKSGNVNINRKQFLHQESFLPLSGPWSVIGRSLVIFNGGFPYACANIIPMVATETKIGLATQRLAKHAVSIERLTELVRRVTGASKNVKVSMATTAKDLKSGCTYMTVTLEGPQSEAIAKALPTADLGEFTQADWECTDGIKFNEVEVAPAAAVEAKTVSGSSRLSGAIFVALSLALTAIFAC